MLFSSKIKAQNVTFSINPNVSSLEIGSSSSSPIYNEYEISANAAIPSDFTDASGTHKFTLNSFNWNINPISAYSTINGISGNNQFSNMPSSSSSMSDLTYIVIGNDANFNKLHLDVSIIFTETVGSTSTQQTTPTSSFEIPINLINTPIISGSSDVDKCCENIQTYTASNFADANQFSWTIPSGWQYANGTNSNSNPIQLIPDYYTGGVITSTVSRFEADPSITSYTRTSTYLINRSMPIIQYVLIPDKLCPNSAYTYAIKPICGATDYHIKYPLSWNLTDENGFDDNYLDQPIIKFPTVIVPDFAEDGDIEISALLACGEVITGRIPVTIIRTLASSPSFFKPATGSNDFGVHELGFYFCNNYHTCLVGINSNYPVDITDLSTLEIDWRLTGGLEFANSNNTYPLQFNTTINNTQSATTTFNTGVSFVTSPDIISSNASGGTVEAIAVNCIGASKPRTISVSYSSTWCNKEINGEPYPVETGLPCADSKKHYAVRMFNNNQNNNKTIELNKYSEISIYPNPTIEYLNIELPNNIVTENVELRIYNQLGQLVKYISNANINIIKLNINDLKNGLYWLNITSNSISEIKPFQIQH